MNCLEAEAVVRRWWAYLDRQEERAKELQKLAVLARTEPEEAKRRLRYSDSQVTVYDGTKLREATEVLLKEVQCELP